VRWTTEKIQALQSCNFVGTPLIVDDVVYATSHERDNAKLTLHCLEMSSGAQRWSADLGTAQMRTNTRGYTVMDPPQLQLLGERLYVLTNNGGLLEFNIENELVESLLKYEPPGGSDPNMGYSGIQTDEVTLHSHGALQVRDGEFYLKEAGGPQLIAVNPAARHVLWTRPANAASVLVGVDERYVYVLERELMAIDRATQRMVWSVALPIAAGQLSVIVGDESLLAFTSRGVFEVSKTNGDVQHIVRGGDLTSTGGRIARIGDKLICISRQAITAYDLGGDDLGASGGSPPGS
jgi:outer membrane protein assembly factor BamB